MLREHLPKLWENNYHNYCIDRKSFKVMNWQHFKAMLVMVCFFPTAKFHSSLVSMFFFFPIIICACFVHDVLTRWNLEAILMLKCCLMESDNMRYMTHGPKPNFLIWETWWGI
jgi:hypothetical protein